MTHQRLVFNGIDGATGKYLRQPMTFAEFATRTRGDRLGAPPRGPMAFLDAADLSEVGWGVLFGSSVEPAVREALAPLLELRQSQAGDLYRDDLDYYGGTWLQFLDDNDAGLGPVDPKKVPYYLLLVGDPQDISFEFQYQLDVQHAVGRLSFETPDEYACYVQGVLEAEKDGGVKRPRQVDLFGVRNWDDTLTGVSLQHLVKPLAEALDGYAGWKTRTWLRDEARKRRLKELLGGDQTPSLLFTASHAIGFWSGDEDQLSDQGGLLCYDWPGPEEWKKRVPPNHYFAARDVDDQADVRGLISFHFACYTAGTPRLDSFSRASGADLEKISPHDFVAALPRRLLGHPRGGALAFVGHVDQTWPHSFVWRQAGSQIAHFEAAFKELMAGKPVGLALESFGQRHAAIAATITQVLEQQRKTGERTLSEDEGQVYLWMAHNDAQNYLLLGDPAVRLPLEPERRS